MTLYTPGSESGVPLNVIGSLKAPKLSWDTDEETIRDEIEGTVSSLLGLVGIEADPIGSREHVLLSNLLEHNWRAGTDLDLGALIGQIQQPPLRKLGVFEVDAFMPPADRNELAIKLNALVASPVVRRLGPRAGARSRPCCSGPRTASRAPPSSISRTSRTRSGSSSSRSCSRA